MPPCVGRRSLRNVWLNCYDRLLADVMLRSEEESRSRQGESISSKNEMLRFAQRDVFQYLFISRSGGREAPRFAGRGG
jgi:hypothetical protein